MRGSEVAEAALGQAAAFSAGQADRGEFVDDDEMEALWKKCRL
jgi:predicted transcriptional regulator